MLPKSKAEKKINYPEGWQDFTSHFKDIVMRKDSVTREGSTCREQWGSSVQHGAAAGRCEILLPEQCS